MSYTNETTYYGLPLPTGSDKSTFTDNNTAFQAVDAALHTAAEQSGAAAEDIVTIKADIVDLKAADVTMGQDIDAAEINIEALQQKELLQDAAIDAVKADSFDMITAYNEPTATSAHAYNVGDFFIYNDVLYKATDSIAIGDTIVPDTNCATTNVTTEIKALNTDLKAAESVVADSANNLVFTDIVSNSFIKPITGEAYVNVSFTLTGDRPAGATIRLFTDDTKTKVVAPTKSTFGTIIDKSTGAVIPCIYQATTGWINTEIAIPAASYQLNVSAPYEVVNA